MSNCISYLNNDNILRSHDGIEYHPLHPFLPHGCKILFLGSFPPQRKRWARNFEFFYPNFINDHWRIEGLIFYGDKNRFVDEKGKTFKLNDIIEFLETKKIGFYDTATAVRRLNDNASDKFLEIVEPTDVRSLIAKHAPELRVIVTTGEKATKTLCDVFAMATMPRVGEYIVLPSEESLPSGLSLYRLPSSSRAYPLSLDKKAEYYEKMFRFAGAL